LAFLKISECESINLLYEYTYDNEEKGYNLAKVFKKIWRIVSCICL